jgi:hypothetical protein
MKKKLVIATAVAVSIAGATASLRRSPDLSSIKFSEECVSVSDPADINVYHHEGIVNSFLDIQGKFGRGRMLVMEYRHQHLATHRGTTSVPGDWRNENTDYKLSDWGMIGDVDQGAAKVYYLGSPARQMQLGKSGSGKPNAEQPALSDRKTDEFESYALAQLKKGEKLIRWERPEFLRYVGTITASSSCLSCHSDAKVGDVLGAFTYDYNKSKTTAPLEHPSLHKAAREGKEMSQLMALENGSYARNPSAVAWQLSNYGFVAPEMIKMQSETRERLLKESTQLGRVDSSSSLKK